MSQRYLGGVITANPTTPTLSNESGVWTLEQQFQNSSAWSPRIVGQSVRFRASASAYFNRTPVAASNQRTWTWSGWVKLGSLSSGLLFSSGTSTTNVDLLYFDGTNNQLYFNSYFAGAYQFNVNTSAVFRDPSAWYHVVFALDTTQATSTNRAKFYVNGVLQPMNAGSGGYGSQNLQLLTNSTVAHNIGRYVTYTTYFDGYMAEVNFIDGQALAPTAFGAFDTNGVWQPISYTGTYGTNGFYLTFGDNVSVTTTSNMGIGKDFSGNGNYWTSNNINPYSGYGQRFTATGSTTWTCPAGVTSVGYLIVAGGGAGSGTSGSSGGGGGGAGGLLQGSASVIPGTTYTITVGTGGIANVASAGGNSSISGAGFTTLTAIGGAGGGSGVVGGSGAGGLYAGGASAGTAGQGNAGANGYLIGSGNTTGGGGGGAGSAGSAGTSGGAGAGGAGLQSYITGVSAYYAGGGAGGAEGNSNASGGTGGGGNSGSAGTANTGGGGGGGGTSSGNAGNGGSGIVILSYPSGSLITTSPTSDSMLDSPTNWIGSAGGNGVGNYPTFSSIDKSANANLSAGNLQFTISDTANGYLARSTMALPSSGKWYWEITNLTASQYQSMAGIVNASASLGSGAGTYALVAGTTVQNAQYYTNGSLTGTWAGITTCTGANDVWMIAFDADNRNMWMGRNGTWYNSSGTANPATNTDPRWSAIPTGIDYVPYVNAYYTTYASLAANFGQRPFAYTPPTGFKALNTLNLPTAVINNGAQHMAAVTYTGNGSTQTITNGGNNTIGTTFQPDFAWHKGRVAVSTHQMFDSLRGVYRSIQSNTANAESNNSPYGVTAFNVNGVSVNDLSGGDYGVNGAAGGTYSGTPPNYISWQWKAGSGVTSSNTNGSITSTTSVNATAGFSVVTYTGTAANATVGHGLGVAPSMILIKNRTNGYSWAVWFTGFSVNEYMSLNTSGAKATFAGQWNTLPTSSVFGLGSSDLASNQSGASFVAYCWAQVAGYSKFGSYTGNGSADGPFVYCGFRPRWIMVKRTDSTGDWYITDTSRGTYNANPYLLQADSNAAEITGAAGEYYDVLSNGFKVRTSAATGINGSGGTFIFAAFAENPFNISRAR